MSPVASLTGKLVLHYKVGTRLGAGGMGEVYAAEDTRLGRQVALKFLSPAVQRDQESRARLIREARAASMLRSPNIAVTYDLVEHGEALFIAMEYVEGEVLSERVRRGPLPLKEAVDVGQQVADALDEAHRQNIIHRDIKSANLILTRRGLVKVLDFGLAKFDDRAELRVQDVTALQLTTPGLVMGTVSYMAPEQLLGEEVDARADVYAAGVVLYEALTGRRPLEAPNPAAVIARILTETPPSPRALEPEVPEALSEAIDRALARDRAARPRTMAELHDLLVRASRAA